MVDWAMMRLSMFIPPEDLTEEQIGNVLQWIGICAPDTFFTQDSFPFIRRMGLGLMITVALLAFPEFYKKHRMSNPN